MNPSTWLTLIGLHLLSLAAAVALTVWATRCARTHLPHTCPRCGYPIVEGRLQTLTWTAHVHRRGWVPRLSGRRPRPALVRHAPRHDADSATREIPILRGGAR